MELHLDSYIKLRKYLGLNSPKKENIFYFLLSFQIFSIYIFVYLCYYAFMDKLSIKNWPEEERPREKLAKFGKEHLTSCELLAIIIGTGCMKDSQSYSALDLASNLISKYSNLKGMIDLSISNNPPSEYKF